MPLSEKIWITLTIIALPVLLLTAVAAAADKAMSERSLAADTIIKEVFQAGTGLPVGKIQSVRGETFIFHRDLSTGYRARSGLQGICAAPTDGGGEAGGAGCRIVGEERVHFGARLHPPLAQRVNTSPACSIPSTMQAVKPCPGIQGLFAGGDLPGVRAPGF